VSSNTAGRGRSSPWPRPRIAAHGQGGIPSATVKSSVTHEEQSLALRNYLTSEQRLAEGYLGIDPGWVHHRKIEAVVGSGGMAIIDRQIKELPDLPDWQRSVRIDHLYTRLVVEFCRIHRLPTLAAILAQGSRTFGSRN
jgi:hypothetical protein